ncbi:MAG TPA: hypothetical protein VK509_12810 [Polyangiales bacterium]|nr:hypothetical protein [Polyangiales bacterium]
MPLIASALVTTDSPAGKLGTCLLSGGATLAGDVVVSNPTHTLLHLHEGARHLLMCPNGAFATAATP